MREGRNIFGWLGIKQEEMILVDAREHVKITYQTVEHFKQAVSYYIANNEAAKKDEIAKVRECEQKADELRKKMTDRLSEGILVPPDREDLMHFVRSLDRIADWTNGAARLLDFLKKPLPQTVLKELALASDIIFESISKLNDAIQALMQNELKKAIADCHEVDLCETKADDQKKLLLESLLNTDIPTPLLLVTYQLAEYLESITDKIEDASDFIKLLAIKAQ